MRALSRACGVIVVWLVIGSSAAANETAVQALHALFDKAWERDLELNPLTATYVGDRRFNDRWPDSSPAAARSEQREYRGLLDALDRIPAKELPAAEQLNRELFRRLYAHRIALYDFATYQRPLDQLNYSNSIQTLSTLPELLSFESERDYRDWLARLRNFGTAVDQVITSARAGIEARNVQPRVVLERVLAQVQAQRVAPEASAFYAPFRQLPASINARRQTELRSAGLAAVREVVLPALAHLERFITSEYLPKSRDTVGIWDTPHGAEYYRHCVQWFTTTDLTPEQVHGIGLNEVARIHREMERVIASTGFNGTFADFLAYLRSDPRFHYSDPQQLLTAYTVMAKRIDPLLTQYFGRLPRTPYGVRAIPGDIARDTTTGYYQPSSADGRRAGYFYVNLYHPQERPTYEIPVLTLHEAVPGHHIQAALAQEAGDLPKFRRDLEATAFVEGWALYAESLGDEMGLYADPYDKFGQLTYEMWRAVRLVVDTGLHAKRWTRDQAIAYFKANTAKTQLDIVNEVDRYIAWPGQATAYKIGELKIKALRRMAAARLGTSFDVRAFHDEVLRSGAVPLDVLERSITAWVSDEESAVSAAPGGAK